MGRKTFNPSRLRFVVDEHSIDRLDGRQIAWAEVPASFENADKVKEIPAGTVMAVANPVEEVKGIVPRSTPEFSSTFTADAASDELTVTAHGQATGFGPVRLTNSGGALPAGLATGTDYWFIVVDVDTVKLATSHANAIAGTAVDVTDAGTGTHTMTEEAEVAIGLLETTAAEGAKQDSLSGYGVIVGGVIYEDLLPETLDATIKQELQDAGTGFAFATFEDSRSG